MKNIKIKYTLLSLFAFLFYGNTMAQQAYHAPSLSRGNTFSLSNKSDLIFVVIIPAIVIVLRIIAYRHKKKQKDMDA